MVDRNGRPCWVFTKSFQHRASRSLWDRLATNVPRRSFLSVSVAISLCTVGVLAPVTLLMDERSVLGAGRLIWIGGLSGVDVLGGKSLSDLVRLALADVLEGRGSGWPLALRLGESSMLCWEGEGWLVVS